MSENQSDSLGRRIERAISEFEEAWVQGNIVRARDFIKADPEISVGLFPELVVCEFECRLEFGHPIPLDELLLEYPEVRAVDDCLLRLAAADWTDRRQKSMAPTIEDYVQKFPHLTQQIREYLELVSALSLDQCQSLRSDVRHSIGGTFGHRSTSTPSASREVNLAGTVLHLSDECELTAPLSTVGAFKDVYHGVQRSTGRNVAAKILKFAHQQMTEECKRFLGEGRTQALLDHQNIPPIFLIHGNPDSPHVLLEKLVIGEKWSASLPTKKLLDNLAVLLKVSVAARYAHQRPRPLVHRDIKPDNVVINDEFQEVYLVDWGMVLDVADTPSEDSPAPHRLTEDGTIAGTLGYMSPEQASGNINECSPASDVFSLGAILYEILTGAPPYGTTGVIIGWVRACKARIDRPETKVTSRPLPLELCDIAMRALSVEPSKRYRDAGEFADAIQHFLNHAAAEEQSQIALTRWQNLRQGIAGAGSVDAHRYSTRLIEIADQFRQARKAWEHPKDATEGAPIIDVGYQKARDNEREARLELIQQLRTSGDLTSALAQVDELGDLVPATVFQPLREGVSRSIHRRRIGKFWLRSSAVVVLLLSGLVAFFQLSRLSALAKVDKLEIENLQQANRALEHERLLRESENQVIIEEQRRREEVEKRIIATRDKLRAESMPARSKASIAKNNRFAQGEMMILGSLLANDTIVDALPEGELTALRADYLDARQHSFQPVEVSSRRTMVGVVAFHPSERLIASGDLLGTSIRVWDADTGQLRSKWRGHSVPKDRGGAWATIRGLAFSPTHLDELLSVGLDGSIRVWSLRERRELRSQQNAASTDNSGLVQLLAVDIGRSSTRGSGNEDQIVTGDLRGRLRWWRYDDLSEIKTVEGHQGAVLDVRFSPDGTTCVSAGTDGLVRLWSSAGVAVREFRSPSLAKADKPTEVQSVGFCSNGSTVAAGMGDGRIHLWNISDGKLSRTLEGHPPGPSGNTAVRRLTAIGNSQLLSSGADGTLKLWNLSDGGVIKTFEGHVPNQFGNAVIRSFAWHQSSQQLVSAGADDTLRLWDFERGSPRLSLEGGLLNDDNSIPLPTRMAFCPKRDLLLTSALAYDVAIRKWDTTNLRETGGYTGLPEIPDADPFHRVHGLAIHPDGSRFVSAEPTGELLFWDTETRQLLRKVPAHRPLKLPPLPGDDETPLASITGVAWSHNGRWVASTGYDRMLKLWNSETGEAVAEWSLADEPLTSFETPNQLMARSAMTGLPLRALEAIGKNVPETVLLFDARDERLISVGRDSAVRIWNVAEKKLEKRLEVHIGRVTDAVMSAGGNLLGTGSDDGFVIMWDLQSLAPVRTMSLRPLLVPGNFGIPLNATRQAEEIRGRFALQVISLAMSPNETTLAAALGDGSVSLIDMASGEVTHRAVGHESSPLGLLTIQLAYTRFGDLLSVGSDQTIRRWNISAWDGKELPGSRDVDGSRDIACSNDGEWAIAGNNFKLVRWPQDATDPLQWRPQMDASQEDAAHSVAFVHGTRKIVVGTSFGRAVVFDRDTNQEQFMFRGPDGKRLFSQTSVGSIVAVSPDGSVAASSWTNGEVDLWRVASGQFIRTLKLHSVKIEAVTFHPKRPEIAITDELGNLGVWGWDDETTLEPRLTLRGPQFASGLEYSHDGRWLVQSGQQLSVTALVIWDADTGRLLHSSIAHEAVAISPGIKSVTVFDAAFSPDDKLLATCGNDATVRFWRLQEKDDGLELLPFNVVSWNELSAKIKPSPGPQPKTSKDLANDTSSVSTWLTSLCFSHDGRQVAVAGLTGPVRLIDVEQQENLSQWTPERVRRDVEDNSSLSVFDDAVAPRPRNSLREPFTQKP